MNLLPPVPGAELLAAPGWTQIDFISDLHLSEATPATFAAFSAYLPHAAADAVFILGDLFETWVGDDARHDGFEAGVVAVLRESAARRPLFFMAGNRDFLVGPELLGDCGMAALSDPTVVGAFGQRVLLTHGDAWCLDDQDYQQFRAQVRQPAWQAQVLARPLAERRLLARSMRSESERRGAEHPAAWADVDRPTALASMDECGASILVHGHTHRPATETIGADRTRHVLSDWDLDGPPQARRAEVMRWSADGWRRLAVQDATAAIPPPQA